MAISEAMTSSTRSFAYSYQLVKKYFVKICETSKCHNFLIFNQFSSGFHCFVHKILLFLLKLSSPLKIYLQMGSTTFNPMNQLKFNQNTVKPALAFTPQYQPPASKGPGGGGGGHLNNFLTGVCLERP